MRNAALLMACGLALVLVTACDDDSTSDDNDIGVGDSPDVAGGAGGATAPDAGIGGAGGGGGGASMGGAGGGAVEDPCVAAVALLLDCGIDQEECAAWIADDGATREEIEAGLLEGCAESAALAAIVNQDGTCEVLDTVRDVSAEFAASCDGTGGAGGAGGAGGGEMGGAGGGELEAYTMGEFEALLRQRCGFCHNPTFRGTPMLVPDTFAEVTIDVPAVTREGMDRIEPGDPEQSYLFHKVRGTHEAAGGRGVQMPPQPGPMGADPLTEDEIERLRLFIVSLE